MLRDNNEIFDSIKNHALSRLEEGYSGYGCDLHNYLFNEDYFVMYHSNAKKIADKWEVDAFELVEYNIDQERDNYGECYWINEKNKLNWESQINLATYWLGQELLDEIQEELEDYWDSEMTKEDVDKVFVLIDNIEY